MATRRPKHAGRDRSQEAELKFRLAGAAEQARLRRRLREIGAVNEGSYDEENFRFAVPAKSRVSLRLRILDGGKSGIITSKGPATFSNGIKVREETEVEVADASTARDLLESLGYAVEFVFHKQRASWRMGTVSTTLDTLDFGFFIELEGPPAELPEAARTLGLNPKQAIRQSYSAMARDYLRETKKLAARS
ncbi:MAG TPA: class IV adenylate cyclase [Candidatus Dormibacteraeota bacterium]|nr:class IV adenylate cyclase [Candidatus Dormibacteraeota bacterium]